MSGTVETKREQVRRILQLPPSAPGSLQDGAARELEAAITAYLRRATETFDLSKNVEVRDVARPEALSGPELHSHEIFS